MTTARTRRVTPVPAPSPQPQGDEAKLRARWAATLEEWIAERMPPQIAPEDWAASGTCARLMAATMRRYVTQLDGDLTDAEVRRDLRCVVAFAKLLLHAGQAQVAAYERAHGREPPKRPRRKEPPTPPLTVAGVMAQARMFAECGETA